VDDVQHSLEGMRQVLDWYVQAAAGQPPPDPDRTPVPRPGTRLTVVPRGPQSFDANDAYFFLDLLPGPRDQARLPQSIRFWEHRIVERNDPTFTVGVIYGPSGCGKSSLVKAGLLPRLAGRVLPVYVEATAADTEARLLKGLRKRCPGLPGDRDLTGTITALRRGTGQKVFIVLDQFEQWLHAKRKEPNAELVQALRQCDGGRVQCLVLVRDDFWLAVSRFMGDLEVELLQGRNMALVDLFDPRHARKVLAAFGRAFGALPERTDALTKEQEAFLDQAVAGLSEDGKIVSVRMALFAEMVKGRPWTPATLKAVGGIKGMGVSFLEATFAAPTAPPQHRLHQKAAQAVLKALLPEPGTDLKGCMRPRQHLLTAAGYGARPGAFEALLRILDGELRLITPTDPEGRDAESESEPAGSGERYYQLTHDYLVHSLRDWQTRKQKETRRGRAELRLAERAAQWNSKPENRHLPAWWEWAGIRLLTRPKGWTPPQRRLMRRAGRYYTFWGTVLGLALGLFAFGGWWTWGELQARAKVDTLLAARTADVPELVCELGPYRRWADPLLRWTFREDLDDGKRLHVALALLPVDAGQADYLCQRLLDARSPEEVKVIRELLQAHAPEAAPEFWPVLEDNLWERAQRLRAACALARFAADDPRWGKVGDEVVRCLAGENILLLRDWSELLKPVRAHLVRHQVRHLVEADAGSFAAFLAMLRAYPEDAVVALQRQLERTAPPTAKVEEKQALAGQQAQAAVALLHLGRPERVWPLFHQGSDPTCRTYLIHRCAALGVDPSVLADRLRGDEENDPSIRQGLLLALGEYQEDQRAEVVRGIHKRRERRLIVHSMLEEQRAEVVPGHLGDWVPQAYRDDPDPGVHSAAEWLLRGGKSQMMPSPDRELPKLSPGPRSGEVTKPRWYVNGQGQTFAVIPAPGAFQTGSPAEEQGREPDEGGRRVRIDYPFAVALKLVTVAEFRRSRPDFKQESKQFSPGEDTPINGVSWYEAAAYCNWLSEQEKIPKDQWCYEPNAKGEYAEDMKVKANVQTLSGYRLPREAEWEYACRAGTVTPWAHGSDPDLLGHYAWYVLNANGAMHPVGSLKPNGLGLFDAHGNASQWWHDIYGKQDNKDKTVILDVKNNQHRVLRGGSYCDDAGGARSASRSYGAPGDDRIIDVGFRVARTYR
jgi:formylglycine-generating enzyme required for sulfatase activity